jgi:hypothetical protein
MKRNTDEKARRASASPLNALNGGLRITDAGALHKVEIISGQQHSKPLEMNLLGCLLWKLCFI